MQIVEILNDVLAQAGYNTRCRLTSGSRFPSYSCSDVYDISRVCSVNIIYINTKGPDIMLKFYPVGRCAINIYALSDMLKAIKNREEYITSALAEMSRRIHYVRI